MIVYYNVERYLASVGVTISWMGDHPGLSEQSSPQIIGMCSKQPCPPPQFKT